MSAKPKTKSKLARRLDELVLAPLAARAWRRGALKGDRGWLVIGALVWLARRGRRREAEVVYSETLAKGQSLRISHQPPEPTRRARRKAKRRARRKAQRLAIAERAEILRTERDAQAAAQRAARRESKRLAPAEGE